MDSYHQGKFTDQQNSVMWLDSGRQLFDPIPQEFHHIRYFPSYLRLTLNIYGFLPPFTDQNTRYCDLFIILFSPSQFVSQLPAWNAKNGNF